MKGETCKSIQNYGIERSIESSSKRSRVAETLYRMIHGSALEIMEVGTQEIGSCFPCPI